MSRRQNDKKALSGAAPATSDTLTDRAYAQLEECIVTLRIKPGAFLSENVVAEELGLGRTPTREALQRLALDGLVTILPRKGILVSPTDAATQLLVLEVRREIERLLSRLAAERATRVEREDFSAIADGMEQSALANDDIAFMRLDRQFNLLIVEAAHNDFAARTMRLLQGHSRRFWYLHYKTAADLPLCAGLHAAQARAIAEGNTKAAGTASDRLADYTETFTRAAAALDTSRRTQQQIRKT